MDVVLLGSEKFASLAWHVLTHDSPHRPVGFAVHQRLRKVDTLHDLPVVDFETVEQRFEPSRTGMLISLGWRHRRSNRARGQLRAEAAAKGFQPLSYVSGQAIVPPGVEIGDGTMVFAGVIIQPFARIGSGVVLRSGSHISHHVEVGDDSFVAASAAIGGGTRLGERCFVGLNATVFDDLTLAPDTMVGAGAILDRDTSPGELIGGLRRRRDRR